jgi:hypothetical protein
MKTQIFHRQISPEEDLNSLFLSETYMGPLQNNVALKDNLSEKLNLIRDCLNHHTITNSCLFTTPEGVPIIVYKTKEKIMIYGSVYFNYLGSLTHNFEILDQSIENTFGYEIDIPALIKKIKFKKRLKIRYIYSFAMTENLGHYIWNECTAMHFLIISNLIFKFDRVYVGQYDYMNLKKILETYGVKVISHDSKFIFWKKYITLKTAALTFSESCRDFLLTDRTLCPSRNAIVLQIRTGNRSWINEPSEFIDLISDLHNRFAEMNFIIDGYSKINPDSIQNNVAIERDLLFYNKILAGLDKAIHLDTTIGNNFEEKIRMLSGSSITVAPIGSGNVISNWLLNKPLICFGAPSYYEWTKHDSETLVYQPRAEVLYFPHEHLSFDVDGNYQTDMKELAQFIDLAFKRIISRSPVDKGESDDYD